VFEPVNLGNPIAEGINSIGDTILNAYQQKRQRDMERAKMLMQQRNIDADNKRADAELSLQQEQFKRTGLNQDEERIRKGAEDFKAIHEAAGGDPAFARELAKAHGYTIVDSPAGPVAVKADTSGPMGGPPVPTPSGPPSDNGPAPTSPPPVANPDQSGNPFFAGPPQLAPGQATPPKPAPDYAAMPDVPAGPAPSGPAASAPSGPPSVANQLMAAFRIRNKTGQEFTIDPAAAKAEQDRKLADEIKLRAAAPDARAAAAAEAAAKKAAEQAERDRKYRPTVEMQDKWHRMMAAAQAAKVAGDSGHADVITLLGQAAQEGADQATLLEIAANGGLKNPVQVVTALQRPLEKQAELEVRGTNGNVIGTASSTRAAKAAADQLAAGQAYKDALAAFRDHIQQYGQLLNPFSDEYKERERLHADAVARGRKAMDLGVSNANLQLEHAIVGGSGAGLNRMASPESLDNLISEADKVINNRLAASLSPGAKVGPNRIPSPKPKPRTATPKQESDAEFLNRILGQ